MKLEAQWQDVVETVDEVYRSLSQVLDQLMLSRAGLRVLEGQ